MLVLAIVLALLVIVVFVLAAGLIVQAGRRRAVRRGDWDAQALEACAAADALRAQLFSRLTITQPSGANGDTPAPRWSDTERSLDQLAVRLHALHFSAPSYTTDQATEDLIMALAALRSALQLEHGSRAVPGVPAKEPVGTAQARLVELDAAVRALRAAV